MQRFIHAVDRLNEFFLKLIGIALGIMTIVIFFQVISRYYLGMSLPWSEELARYLMIWMVLVGTAIGLRKSGLIGIEALVQAVPSRVKVIIRSVIHVFSFIFIVMLVYIGYKVTVFGMTERSPGMDIPMIYVYSSIFVAALLMLINWVVVVIELYTGQKEEM